MKTLLFCLVLLLSFAVQAQYISGWYSGTLVNDSTKKLQQYELALSEYKGRITGYSYTTFIVNDTFYYSIKRVKGQKNKGQLIVEDTKMLVNNFPGSPAKGVHQINIIPLTETDTITALKGSWKTTQTKKYYSLSGAVDMKRENDSTHSQLMAHLTELKILQPDNTSAIAKENKPINSKTNTTSLPAILPYTQRQTNVIQTLPVSADSVVLSFYDNGVVDGDTISVYVNNIPVIEHQLLTAHAVKKTIPVNITKGGRITLLLVAENVGTIPPNTGLIIIQDGTQKHRINFSASLQTNAAIILNPNSPN